MADSTAAPVDEKIVSAPQISVKEKKGMWPFYKSYDHKIEPVDVMHALVLHEYGGLENLKYEKFPKPKIAHAYDVLILVKSAGVNPADWKIRKGLLKSLLRLPLPLILGIEFSGVVSEIGPKVNNFKIGDPVYGRLTMPSQNGAYAEYIKVDAKKDTLCKLPDNLSIHDAGGITVAALTAYTSLVDHGKLKVNDGKRVLIIGASGGVGYWNVQIAKALGAHVTGICSKKNIDYVKDIGADEVIDYTNEKFHENIKNLQKFDIVVDCVGGDDYWKLLEPQLNDGGVYSTIVGMKAHGGDGPISIMSLLGPIGSMAWRSLFGRTSYKWILSLPAFYPPIINEWIKAGTIKAPKGIQISIKEGFKAHEMSETNRVTGKILIVTDS